MLAPPPATAPQGQRAVSPAVVGLARRYRESLESVPRGPNPASAGRIGAQSNTTALSSSPIRNSAPGSAPALATASSIPNRARRTAKDPPASSFPDAALPLHRRAASP